MRTLLQNSPYWVNQLTGFSGSNPAAAVAAAAAHLNPALAANPATSVSSNNNPFPLSLSGMASNGIGLEFYYQQVNAAAAAGLGKAAVHE